jgi:GT2 family glycosyltransferase
MEPAACRHTVSVIIPAHEVGEPLQRCLAAVARLAPAPAEALVVLDGVPEGAPLPTAGGAVRVIRLAERGGPARARNAGARAAGGEILMFVDADVLVSPDAVGLVDALFSAGPDVAAVFGLYDDDPPRVNFLSQYKNLSHHYFHRQAPEEASTFWAGCGAVRREAFLAVGGFDEGFGRPCVEDIELGYRLRRAGRRIRLCKSLQAKHLKVWTARGLLKTEVLDRAVPWTRSILRYRDVAGGPNLGAASRLSVISAYGLLLCALAAPWWLPGLAPAAAFLALLVVANAPLYALFWRRRGTLFMLRGMVWNWFYYLYGGAGFAIGLCAHLLARHRPAAAPAPGREV